MTEKRKKESTNQEVQKRAEGVKETVKIEEETERQTEGGEIPESVIIEFKGQEMRREGGHVHALGAEKDITMATTNNLVEKETDLGIDIVDTKPLNKMQIYVYKHFAHNYVLLRYILLAFIPMSEYTCIINVHRGSRYMNNHCAFVLVRAGTMRGRDTPLVIQYWIVLYDR